MKEKRKNNPNCPNLRFAGFTDEWESRKMLEIANVYDGTHQTPNYVNEGVKFVSVEDISTKEITTKYITKEAFEKDFKIKPRINDILMTRITAGIIGATSIVRTNEPLAYYVSLALIRAKININAEYLSHYINSSYFRHELHKRIIHVAFPQKINLEDIGKCKISITNLNEQNKIASLLSLIDDRIETQSKIIDGLESLMRGFREKLFTQRLRFKDESGHIFPKWESKKLSEVLIIQGGYAFKSDLFNQGITKVIRIGDIVPTIKLAEFSGVFSLETPQKKYVVKKNDFVMALSGATFGKVGKITDDGVAYINQRVATFRTEQYLDFYYQLVQMEDFKSYINSIPTASAQPNISNDDIANYQSVIPCIIEQAKIANFLSTIDEKIEMERQLLTKYTDQKKYLLSKLFI
jgi:type I restriction enzyme S subunit